MMIKKEYTTEIMRLAAMCVDNHIPFELDTRYNGLIISFPSKETAICSAICHDYSAGHREGLLEIFSNVADIVNGFKGALTAEAVFEKWRDYCTKNNIQG